jgi:hypothetical protein
VNSYLNLKEKKQLSKLVEAWQIRRVGETDPGDREDCQAKQLDILIQDALCRFDSRFFRDLAKGLDYLSLAREKRKPKIDPRKLKKIDLLQWLRTPAHKPCKGVREKVQKPSERTDPLDAIRKARASFVPDYRPTWWDVVNVAEYSYNMASLSKASLKRLRRAAGLEDLPDRRAGRRRKD